MPLNREQIFAAPDLPREVVSVPEWGGEVLVKTLTGFERDFFEGYFAKSPNKNLRAILACLVVCDDAGKALFDVAKDAEAVGAKSAAALDRIFSAAIRLNGISKQDVDDLEKKLRDHPFRRFCFRLALALGKTVGELLEECDSRELSEWMAFDRVEPFADPYWIGGMQASVMANAWGSGRKKFKPQDFMPDTETRKPQTAEDMLTWRNRWLAGSKQGD